MAISLALGCGARDASDAPGFEDPAGVRHVDREWVRDTGVLAAARPPAPPGGGDTLDASGLAGTWFVNQGAARLTLKIALESGHLVGTLSRDGSSDKPLSIGHFVWDPGQGKLRFRVEDDGKSSFYAVDVVEGTMSGRYAIDVSGRTGPADWTTNSGHVMGWRSETFDGDLAPRVYDVAIDDGRFVRLRIDRSATDPLAFTGELKVKATTRQGADGELPAHSIFVRRWDGNQLAFDLMNGTTRQRFTGTVSGRYLEGAMLENRSTNPVKFTGTRANVLSYGLLSKTVEERQNWQERVRRTLYRLMMGGNPAPLSSAATVTDRPLLDGDESAADRDDDSAHWRREYRLSDVVLDQTLPNPYGAEPLTRRLHGLLAVPTTPPPAAGYSVVLAVNGHGGSAVQHFQTDGYFWYGDAYARRGYVVLALDISHRPLKDAGGLYDWPLDGDSPETGNAAHPAIAAPGLDSDWAEDGERVWDAMRGIDFLLSQPSINPNQIIVTGLSMGAEVAELAGALDPRVTTVVSAGAPPDLSLMTQHGNHPCWQWNHGDATEFVEVSDFLALTAPRHVIMESGKADWTFSSYSLPYAVEKETAWRARIAYGADGAKLVHYLHSGAHQYRVGDVGGDSPSPAYIQVPQLTEPPSIRRWSSDWQLDGDTVSLDQTLFDYLARQIVSPVSR